MYLIVQSNIINNTCIVGRYYFFFFAKQDRGLQQLKEEKVEIYLVKLIYMYMYIGP